MKEIFAKKNQVSNVRRPADLGSEGGKLYSPFVSRLSSRRNRDMENEKSR